MDGGAVCTVYADKRGSLMGLGVCNGGSLRGSRGAEAGSGRPGWEWGWGDVHELFITQGLGFVSGKELLW